MVRKVMRRKAVLEATGWCRETLRKKINEGLFPKPTKLDPNGRAVVWFEDEVGAFQARATTKEAA